MICSTGVAVSRNQSEVIAARQIIVETAKGILSGSVSPVEGARTIARHRFKARLEDDFDILPFVGIDSETESLPLGRERAHWMARALADLQGKIDKSQAWALTVASTHCQSLVTRSESLMRWPDWPKA
ncbi:MULTISPECIES: hypothetical protein [unclassified Bradyrhizobium]|uniref:hypothetical protein n=1 Tax=unclassified Bradyrhizobium TaxID=2631580 RepID=UPI001CD1BFD2|nr:MULTISPECIES: hypothetical protein [unclassified Bradyrhizobium]MCA1378050.1 hypothetical protein [Bradyrhizobium sp. IC4060]MCA1486856.1 hypothetical protein [Bradyrhizobium sp. IC4061]MCA1543314.1 hypothetical protein [Bradyrhizobium sp. NBAIM32]